MRVPSSHDPYHDSSNMQRPDFPMSHMDFAFPHGMDSANADPRLNDNIIVDASDVHFFESVETDEQNNLSQTLDLECTYHDTEMGQLPDELCPCGFPAQLSRRSSAHPSYTDWQALIN